MNPTLTEMGPDVPTPPPEVTPEDLLRMPDGHRYELVDGQLVERKMGAESSEVGLRLMSRVVVFVEVQRLGRCFQSDCGLQIFPDRPKKVRFGDGSFVGRGRLPDDRPPKGHLRIPPDLIVEVISPNDTADEIEEKRLEYLAAGVRLLWIVYPEQRTVHVYRKEGSPSVLGAEDSLVGEEVLPNFSCKVSELFADR